MHCPSIDGNSEIHPIGLRQVIQRRSGNIVGIGGNGNIFELIGKISDMHQNAMQERMPQLRSMDTHERVKLDSTAGRIRRDRGGVHSAKSDPENARAQSGAHVNLGSWYRQSKAMLIALLPNFSARNDQHCCATARSC
jgi:hypothetical protein